MTGITRIKRNAKFFFMITRGRQEYVLLAELTGKESTLVSGEGAFFVFCTKITRLAYFGTHENFRQEIAIVSAD